MEKKTKIAIAILSVLIFIVISGVIFWYVQKWNKEKQLNTPEEICGEYFEYFSQKEFDKIFNLLCDDSKNKITQEELEKAYNEFYETLGCDAIQINDINSEKIDTYNTNVSYKCHLKSIYGEFEFNNIIKLVKQTDKKYYIEWDYNTIYPNLNEGDIIKINVDEAKRGNIMDRKGVLLAGSGYVSSVGLVPGWMNSSTKENDIKTVGEILGMTTAQINKKLSASYVKNDTFVELDILSKQDAQKLGRLREIEGIKIKDLESRVYPFGEKVAHVTGYVQKVTKKELEENKKYNEHTLIGRTGLEKAYDERLRGKDGYDINLVDKDGKQKTNILKTEKVDGENIKLTIDSTIQNMVFDTYKGDKSATVIMNPGTGEIIALVSTPSYDPNKFLIGMSNSEWEELNKDENSPLYARFLKRYVPGSTIKPIIGAIALETGTINSYDEYEKSGTSWQKDKSWGSYYITTLKEYNEPADITNALINSDNIFFAKTALKIGDKKLEEALKELGFEKDLEFDLETKKSQISNEGKFTSEIQLADSGYGQGQLLLNPIHYASIYGIFANNGNMVKPYIEIKPNTETVILKEHVFSNAVNDVIKNCLIQTIENPEGTAKSAKIDGIKLAGKTGTAETKTTKEEEAKEIGWFNAFIADSNSDKQYVIVSMVENVENKGGSEYVVQKVRKLFGNI